MKTIIKHGNTKFNAYCSICGCEFTYELEDICKDISTNYVICPECGEKIYILPPINYKYNYLNYSNTSIDCDGCYFKSYLDSGKIYVGDTPCTFCNKGNRITSTNATNN